MVKNTNFCISKRAMCFPGLRQSVYSCGLTIVCVRGDYAREAGRSSLKRQAASLKIGDQDHQHHICNLS